MRRNHCSRKKAISITHSECVSLALVIQYALRMCRIAVGQSVWLYHIFPHYLIKGTHKMYVVDFLYNFCLQNFSF